MGSIDDTESVIPAAELAVRSGAVVVSAGYRLAVDGVRYPAPLDDASFAGHWVFALASRHVRDVMVGGQWAVLDRRLARADQRELAEGARTEAERLWKRLDAIGPHPFQPKGGRPWPSPLTTV